MVGLFDWIHKKRPRIHLEGTKSVDVVGLSHYESDLRRVVQRNPEERARIAFTATLVPESTNRHDPNAIAILGEGRTVGHMSREDAAKYRPALERIASGGATITAAATIYAGHHGGKSWSVSIKLPTPDRVTD